MELKEARHCVQFCFKSVLLLNAVSVDYYSSFETEVRSELSWRSRYVRIVEAWQSILYFCFVFIQVKRL